MKMTKIKPIRSEADYNAALLAIVPLMAAEPKSDEADEKEHYPIEAPDPIEAIKFHMEQRGLERKDFAQIVGQNRATEILKKQRKLNLTNIRAIVDN